MNKNKTKLIVIGIDGASYTLIKEHASRLRFFSKLLKNDNLKPLISTIPPSTVPAWMSIFTGVNPGKHGYFGFTEQHDYEYKLVKFNNCPIPKIWNTLSDHGFKSVVINVPIVYPVEVIRGAMIAGMFSPTNELNEKTVFPRYLIPMLKKLNYIIDIDISKLRGLSSKEIYYKLSNAIEARTEAFKLLMEHFNAEFGVIVYTEVDRVQHLFWYDKELVLRIYELVDRQVSELLNHFDSPIIIVSDHGFRGVKRGIIGNLLLHELGYLKFRYDYYKLLLRIILRKLKGYKPSIEYEVIDWSKTQAYFRRDTWGFVLNLAGRQPNGIVSQKEYEKILDRLISALESTNLFDYLYESSKLYQGSFTYKAPDILVIPRQDIKLLSLNEAAKIIRPSKTVEQIMFMRNIIKNGYSIIEFNKKIGEHDLKGIIGVYEGCFRGKPAIFDITPSILEFFHIKIPTYSDGKAVLKIS